MEADDADVTVISAHLARMALDALRPPEQSDYPFSAYVIGLRREWIFQQPFEVYPLQLSSAQDALSPTESDQPNGALEAAVRNAQVSA